MRLAAKLICLCTVHIVARNQFDKIGIIQKLMWVNYQLALIQQLALQIETYLFTDVDIILLYLICLDLRAFAVKNSQLLIALATRIVRE